MSVKISVLNYKNIILETETVSDIDVEFHFVLNALNYIKENKDENRSYLELYEEYLIKLAINSFEFESNNNVVTNLHVWIRKNINFSKFKRRVLLKVDQFESNKYFIF